MTEHEKKYALRELAEIVQDLWKALGGPEHEITQQKLGEKLGVSQGDVSAVLAGGKRTQWQKHFSMTMKLTELCRQHRVELWEPQDEIPKKKRRAS